MTIEFKDAEYVKPQGTGRKAEPNPYTDIIAHIALQTTPDGKPVTKMFVLEHAPGERDKAIARVKRKMSDAGADNVPPVTVVAVGTPVKNPVNQKVSETKTEIRFWTTKRQERRRKPGQARTDTADVAQTPDENTPQAA